MPSRYPGWAMTRLWAERLVTTSAKATNMSKSLAQLLIMMPPTRRLPVIWRSELPRGCNRFKRLDHEAGRRFWRPAPANRRSCDAHLPSPAGYAGEQVEIVKRLAPVLSRWRRREQRLRFWRLRRRNGYGKELPLSVHGLEGQVEIDLQGPCWEKACEPHSPARVYRGIGTELWGGERHSEEIEFSAAQIEEALGKIGGGILSLELRPSEIAEHGIVAGPIRIVEHHQGGADKVSRLPRTDGLRYPRRRLRRAVFGRGCRGRDVACRCLGRSWLAGSRLGEGNGVHGQEQHRGQRDQRRLVLIKSLFWRHGNLPRLSIVEPVWSPQTQHYVRNVAVLTYRRLPRKNGCSKILSSIVWMSRPLCWRADSATDRW